MEMVELTGLPIAEDIEDVSDLPYTLTSALTYRARINSLHELPKEKQPPRNLWDKPYRLREFLEDVFDTDGPKNKTFIDFDPDSAE